MADSDDDILNKLPARLRKARQARRLSLDAVAALSGVSRSMVSQIERGESSPTIATLWNLTRALNVDFAGLLDAKNTADKIEVLTAATAPTIDNLGDGCRIAILSPPQDAGGHEVYDINFEADGRLKSAPHAHGAAEQLTVLAGSVRVASGAAVTDLSVGDTARYAADVPHEISARNGPARIFLIVKASEGPL